jgi:hypothetical protein
MDLQKGEKCRPSQVMGTLSIHRVSLCKANVNQGDISLQNWDAQDSDPYLFLPLADARKQVSTGWAGREF